jgi:hypothetical protein
MKPGYEARGSLRTELSAFGMLATRSPRDPWSFDAASIQLNEAL